MSTVSSPNVFAVAQVACRQLGYNASQFDAVWSQFRNPTVNVEWALTCTGTEASLAGCTTDGFSDAGPELGVSCYNSSATSKPGTPACID